MQRACDEGGYCISDYIAILATSISHEKQIDFVLATKLFAFPATLLYI